MAARSTTKRRTTKKAVVEDDDLEDDDLDVETEEDEEPAPKSRKKPAAKKAAAAKNGKATKEEVLGSAWLKEHVNDTLGTEHESTKLRIILRKLIKDGTIDSPKDGRYIFTGPRDPNVKAVVAALREEAKSGGSKRGRKAKAKAAAAEVDDTEDEVEDLDLDD